MANVIDGKGNTVVWSTKEIEYEWTKRVNAETLEFVVIVPKSDRLVIISQTGDYWQYAGFIKVYGRYGQESCYLTCGGGRMFKSYVEGGVRRVREKTWMTFKGFVTGTYGLHTTMIGVPQLDEGEAPHQTNGILPEQSDSGEPDQSQ